MVKYSIHYLCKNLSKHFIDRLLFYHNYIIFKNYIQNRELKKHFKEFLNYKKFMLQSLRN